MTSETRENIDVIAWLIGLIVLASGVWMQWGGPAAMIVVGGLFSIWPLVKAIVRYR
jgi:hypothetical protein